MDWTDPKVRQQFLAEIVGDAEQLLELVRGTRSDLTKDSPEDKELVAAAEVLARILGQDIERDEDGPRLKRGVAPDRLISIHDPEMRHGRKSSSHRFNGHKAQVAVDTDSQLITAVEVLPGNAPDADKALEVVEASEAATGCEVEEVIGDCAYGAGETWAEFAASGRTLVAKVPEIQNQGYFAKTDFQIDLEAGTCTCPNTQTTSDLRLLKGGGGTFVFATATCAACPLRAQCTRGQGGRTVQVHPQEALLQQARELQTTPAFDEARRRRQVVEHTKRDGDARWWNTASHAWCNWAFAKRATSGAPRPCSRCAWQRRWPLHTGCRGIQHAVDGRFGRSGLVARNSGRLAGAERARVGLDHGASHQPHHCSSPSTHPARATQRPLPNTALSAGLLVLPCRIETTVTPP